MNWKSESFNWNQAKSFLTAFETGSLSAAGRQLGLTQPTISRQISMLEESLGVILFERGHRSLSLTQSGIELLVHVRNMQESANRVILTASGQSQTIEGDVCITASDAMATYQLPPLLKKLGSIAPGIRIEVQASNDMKDLLRREADIAIRHVEPQQSDLITKYIRDQTANLYASPCYLDEYGRPECKDDLLDAVFIGHESPERSVAIYNSFGLPLSISNIKYIVNSGTVINEMISQGLGIGILDSHTAALTNNIEQVLKSSVYSQTYPVWLTTHRELHTSQRIRIVFDFLAEELTK
jgi:DNA-binding transcriptional LysR family regulator